MYRQEGVYMVRDRGQGNSGRGLRACGGFLWIPMPYDLVNRQVKVTVEEIEEKTVYHCERCGNIYEDKTLLCACKGRITNWPTKVEQIINDAKDSINQKSKNNHLCNRDD